MSPIFPVGDLLPILRQEVSAGDFYRELYNSTKSQPFVGIYNFHQPTLLVNDPEMMKSIMVRDFSSFMDRGVYSNEKDDVLSGGLFQLSGPRWRQMRAKLTPMFTSGKIKGMFTTINSCANKLEQYVKSHGAKGVTIEVRDLMARYSTDIISSVGFGLEVDCINKPDEKIRKVGRKLFELSILNGLRFVGQLLAPQIFRMLRMRVTDREVEDFFVPLIKSNVQYREQNNLIRKDFIQLMVQLRNSGSIKLNDDWTSSTLANESEKTMTLNEVVAQSFIFWAAGFETTSATMSFCLFELARNPAVLQNLQNGIDEVLQKNNNEFTYETLQQITYLDNCIDETLRKYPPLPVLQRQCLKPYTLPGSELTIEPGTNVFFPIIGLQRDPELYQQPERFNPERFTDPAYERILKTAYYPFGDGPRNCIAFRLGKVMVKLGVATIVSKFNIALSEEHDPKAELKLNRHALLLAPEDGIRLKLTPRGVS